MQTRGIPNEMYRLRKALPYTHLQITIHQPQFDFENESADAIETLVEEYCRQVEYHDMELVVVINKSGKQVDRNIESFYQILNKL